MKKKAAGFIIPLTFMLISIASVFIFAIYQRGSLFVPFITTMYDREQARQLALSGVQIAISQLASLPKAAEKKEQSKPGAAGLFGGPQENPTQFFAHIFPKMYNLQEFKLQKEIDGINGSIAFLLASEEGKININSIFDFTQKKFVGEGAAQGDWKKIMQQFFAQVQKTMGISANLFEGFEKFLKQRQYKVNDASELLAIEAFRPFIAQQFYEPPQKETKERPLHLLDLFTVYGHGKLQPWLLSDAMRAVLGAKRPESIGKELGDSMTKKFKPQVSIANDWKSIFAPLYGIEFQALPKGIDVLFETTFDPKLFSVVSYGVVGQITMRAYAILERVTRYAQGKSRIEIKIKKFYWI